MSRGKRRGVRASRIKLEAALAASSLPRKTQAALADAIADQEELEAAPKDLVSKLFRELPVDPHTIERVARVLGVDAASLYRDDGERAFAPAPPAEAPPDRGRFARAWRWALLSLLLLIGAGALIGGPFFSGGASACSDGLVGSDAETPPDRLGIIIARFTGDPRNEAQMLLARSFAADDRLRDHVEVLTTCRRLALPATGAYRGAVDSQRQLAARDLEAADAQLLIWGERFDDRLNIRFATLRDGDAPVHLQLDGKSLAVNEIDFTMPVRLTADRTIPSAVKYAALDLMHVEAPERAAIRKAATHAFNSSIDWLRDAVISDRNLLRSLSPETHSRLYTLTGNQLCYRHRLLGEHDGDESEFARAEAVCRDVLAHVSKAEAPQEWASLQVNLGSVILRRHFFAETAEERIAELHRARRTIEQAEPFIDADTSPDNFRAYHRNLGVVHLRLGELTPGPEGVAHIERALELTETSLTMLDPEERPADYAQARQNLCNVKNRLGERTETIALIEEAIEDCRAATETISPISAPRGWAMAQNNLAISHALSAEMKNNPAALRAALDEFARAQQVYTRADYPANWAEVEANKGELTCKLAILTAEPDLLPRSVARIEAAQQIFREKGLDLYVQYTGAVLSNIRACDRSRIRGCGCSP